MGFLKGRPVVKPFVILMPSVVANILYEKFGPGDEARAAYNMDHKY